MANHFVDTNAAALGERDRFAGIVETGRNMPMGETVNFVYFQIDLFGPDVPALHQWDECDPSASGIEFTGQRPASDRARVQRQTNSGRFCESC